MEESIFIDQRTVVELLLVFSSSAGSTGSRAKLPPLLLLLTERIMLILRFNYKVVIFLVCLAGVTTVTCCLNIPVQTILFQFLSSRSAVALGKGEGYLLLKGTENIHQVWG